MKTFRRVEWRGELFAADLASFLGRLSEARVVPYELPHTLTIFLQQERAVFDLDLTLRARSYCRLPDLEPESLHRAVAEGLSAKLQYKAASGETTEMVNGPIMLPHTSAERAGDGWCRLQLGGGDFVPTSVRVARRAHYELPPFRGRPPARVTIDHERALFRVVGGALRPLGEMGPRVEIKTPDAEEADRVLELLNPDGLLRRLRYRSLELLFQDMLRDDLPRASGGVRPEIEAKFELAAGDMARAAAAVIGWLDRRAGSRLLLPHPHQVVRMRRYHFCEGEDDGVQHTIVETAAGRLSAKAKRGEVSRGHVFVRDTLASHSTDLDGSKESVESFARRHGWRRFNMMTKVQAKIPFALAGGNAYLVSVDDCLDLHGTPLRQLEFEYIGSLGAPPQTEQVCEELEALAVALREGLPELGLRPTAESKFGFYRRHSRN
jgi:hypothetical protein